MSEQDPYGPPQRAPEDDDWLAQLVRAPAGTVLFAAEPAASEASHASPAGAPPARAPTVAPAPSDPGEYAGPPATEMAADNEAGTPVSDGEVVRELPIDAIHPHPDQPRRTFDAEDLAALAASIAEQGVIQPVVARPLTGQPGQFQLVVGERRWRAARLAGLDTIPAMVRVLGDIQSAELALVENIQRADLAPLEEARAYAQLIDRHGHTQDDLARRLGKSRSHVAHMLRLLRLPVAVQEKISDGAISVGHARVLVNASDPAALAHRIITEGLSVRQTEAAAKSNRPRPIPQPPSESATAPDREAWATRFRTALDRPVTVKPGRDGGSIVIRYHTEDDLAAILARMGG